MHLNHKNATLVNSILSSKDVKANHINSENYAKLLYFKRKLRNAIDEIISDEQQAAIDCGWDETKPDKFKDFQDKLKAIQKAFSVEVYDPFLSIDEFKPFVAGLDVSDASVLAEFLLKDFNE